MNGQGVAPGWYPDPSGSGGMRWWDGRIWHEPVSFATGSAPQPPRPAPPGVSPLVITAAVLAVVVILVGAIVVANGSSGSPRKPTASSKTPMPTTATTEPVAVDVPPGDASCGCRGVHSAPVDPPVTSPRVSTPITTATAMPTNGGAALIAVDAPANTLTVETNLQDVRYAVCVGFQAFSASGNRLTVWDLRAGDFAAVTVDPGVPCVSRVAVSPAPAPPECAASGYGGGAEVTFVGYNAAAHSVLYRPTGPNEPVLAARWCDDPPIVGADGAARSLARVPGGSTIELMLSNGDWITSVTVK